MAITIIHGHSDEKFDEVKEMFYQNFMPDDWDYIIIGPNEFFVSHIAFKLEVCDSDVKYIDGQWVAVTYHS